MVLGIVGAFGDTNFGDYAMLINNIYSIQPRETVVFTYNGILSENLKEKYLKEYEVLPVVVKNRYQFEMAYGDQYQVYYDDEVLIPTQILGYICNERQVREAVQTVDILLVCGGGYFNHVWNARHRKGKLLSILGTILIANEEKKQIVFGGNTFGPFDESSEFYKSFFLALKNPVYASRDDIYSVANLRQLGVEGRVRVISDDLYFLDRQFYKFKPDMGLVLPESYIVLELYCSLNEIKDNYIKISSFVKSMYQQYGLRVVFVSLDRGFGGEEQGKALEVIPDLIIWHFDGRLYRSVEDILYVVKHAQFVVCQRYHLFLFAIANNIPVCQILKTVCGDKRYYYSKSNGLLRQVFQNQTYKESVFFVHEMGKGLSDIFNDYNILFAEQRKLFNEKKRESEARMKQVRREYNRSFFGS